MGAAKVRIREIDLTTRVPGFPGVYGAVVISAKRGPIGQPTLITSETQLLRYYTPNEKLEVGFDNAYYTALAFLQKADKLWVMRAIGDNYKYAGATVKTELGTSDNETWDHTSGGLEDPESYTFTPSAPNCECLILYASDPGDWPNAQGGSPLVNLSDSLGFRLWVQREMETIILGTGVDTEIELSSDDAIFTVTQIFSDGEPVQVKAVSGATLPNGITEGLYYTIYQDATHIMLGETPTSTESISVTSEGSGEMTIKPVYGEIKEPNADALLEFYRRGNENVAIESFYVSMTQGTRDGYGKNIYIEDVLESSMFCRAMVEPTYEDGTAKATLKCQPLVLYLDGGDDGDTVVDGDMMTAVDVFANAQDKMMTVLMDGGWATVSYQKYITNICENRKDSVAILSVPYDKEASSDYINEIVNYRKYILNLGSSHAALYSPHVKIYCKDTRRSIYVSPDGYAGAAISFSAYNYEMWYPAAELMVA